MSIVYRDRNGVEYESVPLPTHEVTDAVPIAARLVGRGAVKRTTPFYDGVDGTVLAAQPRGHRKQWSDAQWAAFEEQRRVESERSRDEPVASAVVIKSSRDVAL